MMQVEKATGARKKRANPEQLRRRKRIQAMWRAGKTHKEMAAALDMTPGAVAVEMRRMRKAGWKLPTRGDKGVGRPPGSRNKPRFEPASPEDFQAVADALNISLEAAQREATLTPAERVARDMSVIAGIGMGLRPATIAERVGLSESHVQRILDAHRQRRPVASPAMAAEILRDALEGIEANIEVAALMHANTKAPWPVRLGAMRTKTEMQVVRLELLQLMGVLPQSASAPLDEHDARRIMLDFVAYLRRAGVAEQVIDGLATEVLPARVVQLRPAADG